MDSRISSGTFLPFQELASLFLVFRGWSSRAPRWFIKIVETTLMIFFILKGQLTRIFCRSTKPWLLERYLSSYPGRTSGWKRFWNQLNNWKTVSDGPYICVNGANRNPWTGYRICPSPAPTSPLATQTGGLKRPPSKLQPNRRPQI